MINLYQPFRSAPRYGTAGGPDYKDQRKKTAAWQNVVAEIGRNPEGNFPYRIEVTFPLDKRLMHRVAGCGRRRQAPVYGPCLERM